MVDKEERQWGVYPGCPPPPGKETCHLEMISTSLLCRPRVEEHMGVMEEGQREDCQEQVKRQVQTMRAMAWETEDLLQVRVAVNSYRCPPCVPSEMARGEGTRDLQAIMASERQEIHMLFWVMGNNHCNAPKAADISACRCLHFHHLLKQ